MLGEPLESSSGGNVLLFWVFPSSGVWCCLCLQILCVCVYACEFLGCTFLRGSLKEHLKGSEGTGGGLLLLLQTALPCVSQTWRPETPAEGECHPQGSWKKPAHTAFTLNWPLSQKGRSGDGGSSGTATR